MRDTLFDRPVTIMGCIVALQTFLYGLGYLRSLGFAQTVLYMEMDKFLDPRLFGVALMVMAALLFFALTKIKTKIAGYLFDLNSFLWLFAFFIYILHGTPVLGLAIAGINAMFSGYAGFVFKYYHSNK